MTFKDVSFCASPGCKNKCGRKMTLADELALLRERTRLAEMSEDGNPQGFPWVSYMTCCDENGELIDYDWIEINFKRNL